MFAIDIYFLNNLPFTFNQMKGLYAFCLIIYEGQGIYGKGHDLF